MGYVNKISIGEGTHLIEPTLYAAATKNGAAYTASIDNNFNLVSGVVVNIKFTATNETNATLNINDTGAKNIYYNNAAITANILKANHIYNFVYDGTNWQLIGNAIGTDASDAAAGDHVHGNITNDGKIGTATSRAVYTTTGGLLTAGSLSVTDNTTVEDTATTFVAKVTQNGIGKITVTKAALPTATTSIAGITIVGASGGAAAYDHDHEGVYAPVVTGGYLPLSGGTMTDSINRYYNTANGTPMITIRSNNKDTTIFNIGHASSSSGTISSNYILQYTGASDNPDNKLVLIGYNSSGTAATAISINQNGVVSLPSTTSLALDITGNAATATTASKLTTSNLGSSTKPIYLVAGVATEGDTYAGGTAITLNNSSKTGSTASFYAPTSGGTQYQILVSGGSNAPTWTAAAKLQSETSTTKNENPHKYTTLELGNNVNISTTTAHSEGKIVLYSAATAAHEIVGESTTVTYTHTLPNRTGTIALTSDVTDSRVEIIRLTS